MLLKYLDRPELAHAKILFRCDNCSKEYRRMKSSDKKMKNNPLCDKDYCLSCWRTILNNIPETRQRQKETAIKNFDRSPEAHKKRSDKSKQMWNDAMKIKMSRQNKKIYENPAMREKISFAVKQAYIDKPCLREKRSKQQKALYENHPELKVKMSNVLKNKYKDPNLRKKVSMAVRENYARDPTIASRISAALIASGANRGDKNGMKQPEARRKVSEARKEMMKDPKLRAFYAQKTREAWTAGKFDGVAVGQCKWYGYQHSNGKIYKVQGTWELAFIKWIDKNQLSFKCHRGWIPYILNSKKKNWYPDFWIDAWDSYVDVKCEHFYSEEKFTAIRSSNPNMKIKILFKKDLLELGIEI